MNVRRGKTSAYHPPVRPGWRLFTNEKERVYDMVIRAKEYIAAVIFQQTFPIGSPRISERPAVDLYRILRAMTLPFCRFRELWRILYREFIPERW